MAKQPAQNESAVNESAVDVAAIGYPAVRRAFNEVLNACVDKLAKADIAMARELLGVDALDGDEPDLVEFLSDTALFSRREEPLARKKHPRPIDRIAPKLPVKGDPLEGFIAARLPQAVFSIFAVGKRHPHGGLWADDLIDRGRRIRIMDDNLAGSAGARSLFAGRFLDLGPWHIGFGIVLPLRKSEAVAIGLTLSLEQEVAEKQDDLHELIYPARLHGQNLVMEALTPTIMTLAVAIDTGAIEPEELASLTQGLGLGQK